MTFKNKTIPERINDSFRVSLFKLLDGQFKLMKYLNFTNSEINNLPYYEFEYYVDQINTT